MFILLCNVSESHHSNIHRYMYFAIHILCLLNFCGTIFNLLSVSVLLIFIFLSGGNKVHVYVGKYKMFCATWYKFVLHTYVHIILVHPMIKSQIWSRIFGFSSLKEEWTSKNLTYFNTRFTWVAPPHNR